LRMEREIICINGKGQEFLMTAGWMRPWICSAFLLTGGYDV